MNMHFGPPPIFIFFFGLIATIIIGGILFAIIVGLRTWSRNNAAEVVSVPALIVAKRTNVSHSTDSSSSTTYYITFELEDGERLEFRVRGEQYGLLVEGDSGTLVYQGTRLHNFQRQSSTLR